MRRVDRSVAPAEDERVFDFCFGAVIFCACGLLLAGLAVRSQRAEVVMRTTPGTPATVLTLRRGKSLVSGWITFVRTVDGEAVPCRTETVLGDITDKLYVGMVLSVIPRPDSCGEPVIVGEHYPKTLAAAGVMALLASFALGTMCRRKVLRGAASKDR